MSGESLDAWEVVGDAMREPNPYDAARAESDLAYIAKKRREIEWWQHNIAAAEEKIARAEDRLKAFAINYRATVGGSQISLANGFVTVNKARERTEVYDRVAWNKWVEAGTWSEDYYDRRLNESKVKGLLNIGEDGTFFLWGPDGSGLLERKTIPGIRRVKPGPLDFTVKINAGRTFAPGVTTWDEQTTSGEIIPGHHDTEEKDDADAE